MRSSSLLSLLLLLSLSLTIVFAAVPSDLITSLPGYNNTLPTKQYSGYITIDATNGRALHYWFVESERNPAQDPIVLWLNGGPGCSSLDGYFYEQGPFHFVNPDGSDGDIPALQDNPYRWNQIANMIFLEAPAGVGFSYSNTSSDYNTNDNITALDNFHFLYNFFTQAFPEYANNDFYVAGESYAGIYVPTLVYQIYLHNQAGESNIPLKGFLVGNGCSGNAVGICSPYGTQLAIDFLHGHALFSEKLYQQITTNCPDPNNPSPACSALLLQMGDEVNNVNIYDIYQPCIIGNGGEEAKRRALESRVDITPEQLSQIRPEHYHMYRPSNMSRSRRIPTRMIDVVMKLRGPAECIDGIAAGKYLNNPTVREAIHVKSENEVGKWSICSDHINYFPNTPSLYPIYPTLIKNYRTLIYNGDVDACVPYNDNEHWTSNLNIPVSQDWHAWFVDQQVAGYATSYQLNNFTFITVKGSGHMVPQFQPSFAYNMFDRFINQQPF